MSAPTLDELIRSHLETLESAPGDDPSFRALEAIYEEHGRFEELVKLYEARALALADPGAAPELLVRAAALARRRLGNAARAEELYRRALAADVRDAEALHALVEIYEERGDPQALAEALEREADAAPDRPAAAALYLRLGRVHEEALSRRDRAVLFYGRALRLDPSLGEARNRAFECQLALRHFSQAKQTLDAARAAGADGGALAAGYARLGARLADEPLEHGLAMEVLVEALALDRGAPGVAAALERLEAAPRTWRAEAQALREEAGRSRERHEAAALLLRAAALHAAYDPDAGARIQEDLDRAFVLWPGMPQALEFLRRWYGEREDWRGLADALVRAAASTRDRAAQVALHLELGQIELVRFGDPRLALAAFERALELDPTCEPAALQCFEIHVDAGRDAEALAVLDRHLAAAPQKAAHAPLRVRAAEMALSRLHDRERARRHLEAALRAAPSYAPAASALAPLLAGAGEWRRHVEVLEVVAAGRRDASERARLLEQVADVQADRLQSPREALRTLSRALQADPRRALARRAMEAIAGRAGAFADLARAYRSAAAAAEGDPRTRKALLRRVAEIHERDLNQPEEALEAWREIAALDPADADGAAALEEMQARIGRHAEVARGIARQMAQARGAERRDLARRLGRLHQEAGEPDLAASAWREALAESRDDPEALRGLASALEALGGVRAAEELVTILGRLAGQGVPDRVDLELQRAALLLDPLEKPGEAAQAYLGLVRGGGLGPDQSALAVGALERLLARGTETVKVAQSLAALYASAGDSAKHVAMLELLADHLPGGDGREKARLLLDAATIRADRLGDPRGALDDAGAALRASPGHPEARRRAERLAAAAGAWGELYALLVETASHLEGRPEEERALRLEAARLAEEELGAPEDAAAQLRRCLSLVPGDPEVLASLTRVALAGERWEEACDLLLERSRAAAGAERNALLVQLAETLLERLQSPAAAADVFEEALGLAPPEQRPRLLARLARAREMQGDAQGQARALASIASSSGDLAEAARAFAEQGRIQEVQLGDRLGAARTYRTALERDPSDARALAALEVLLGDERPDVALEAAQALAPAYERLKAPAKRARALELEARALREPAARARAFRRIARLRAEQLKQPAEAFAALSEAVRSQPGDAEARRELRALAEEAHLGEACARLHDELLEATRGEAAVPILRELADWCERQLGDRDRAAGCQERILSIAPGDPEALQALRRLHRAAGRWPELWETCASLAERTAQPAERLEIWREAAAVAESRLGDPARAAQAWRRVAELAPSDPAAPAALERLYDKLDQPAELAWALERRRAAAPDDVEVAVRLAEVARTRLGEPGKAVGLLAGVLRAQPGHAAAVAGLLDASREPGPAGAEALAAVDAALRAAGAHARRAAAREGRLRVAEDPEERARLHGEIRAILERDLGDAPRAFEAARRAFAEGGRPREEARPDLERLAAEVRRPADLARAYEEAVSAAAGEEALALARAAARVRDRSSEDAAGAVEAWKRVLSLSPDDAEALEALDRLYTARSSASDLVEVTRRRARLAAGAERRRLLLQAGELLGGALGDATGAEAAYREVLAADPHDLEALEALERIYAREKRLDAQAPVLEVLAEIRRDEPARRLELLLRLAAVLEQSGEAARCVEALAEVLAESPQEPAAVAGLERLVSRADTREPAARMLEDVYRAAGDARKLVGLLELRLDSADAAERVPLLAEVAALHERLGQRPQAFLAKIRQYREALRAGGDDPGLRADLERLAGETGAYEDLAAALEDALDQGASGAAAVEIRRRLASICADRLQDLDRAARFAEQVAAASPSPESFGALARIHRRRGDHRALAELHLRQAAVATSPSAQKDLLFEAATIMEDHLSDREGAIQAYRQILAVDPEDPNALRLLSRLLGAAERWDELAEVLAREVAIADRRPNFAAEAAELRFRLGRIRQQRLGDVAGAMECYRDVLARVPRHPAALAALEELSRGTGPAAVEAASLLEPIYQHEGEHQKLVETLASRLAGLADAAGRAALLRRMARVYAGPLRDPEMAFLTAGRAVREDPDGLESVGLAVDLADAAGLEEEIQALLAENADRPREPASRAEYRRRLARMSSRPGRDPQRAAEEWQRLLDLVPDDPEALEGLSAVYRAAGAGEPLAQVLRRRLSIEENPARRAALLSDLAQVQEERLKDLAGAVQSLKRLLEVEPGDREALARLDRLCVRTEKWVDLGNVLAREIAAADETGDAAAAILFRFRLGELRESRLLDREGAVALYEEILSGRPDHAETIARLEGLLQRDPANARAAAALEAAYGKAGSWQKYASVLQVRADERPDPVERKALFLELAEVREKRLQDPELAFLALCRAFREDPADAALRASMERLAEATEHHEELAAIYEDELDRLGPAGAPVALKLGALYEERLAGPQRAAEFFERARRLDPASLGAALPPLDRLYRKLERWEELAEVLAAQAGRETRPEERVSFLFRLGQLCEERLGAPDRAVAAFEAVLSADPRHLPALRALERLYEAGGRLDALLQNLAAQRDAAADAAARERLATKMAQVATSLGRDEEAVGLWREALALHPRHEQALAALEALLEKLGRWPELAELCRTRIAATADRREIARLNDKLGWIMGTQLGDASQAIQSFKAVLDSDPRNRRALDALRDIYAAQGDRESLAGVYRRLIPLQEDAAGVKRVRLDLAEVLLSGGQRQEAVEQGKRAFDLEPHGVEDLSRLERIFEAAGAVAEGVRAAEARAGLLASGGRGAEAVSAWTAVADLWAKQKKPDAAAAALEKALELEPGDRATWQRLREIHAQSGNWRAYARASDLFLPQLADKSERIALHRELAEIHEKRLGQKEMAFLSLGRALQEDPADAEAQRSVERLAAETEAFDELSALYEQVADEARGAAKARMLIQLGRVRDEKLDDVEGAEAAFRKALEVDPGSVEALDALTHLFGRRGRVRELAIALEQKLEAAAGLEEKKATLLEVAKIYDQQLDDLEEAVSALRRVLELDPGDPAAIQALSALYRREGRWNDLAGILARARDLAADDAARVAYQLQVAGLHENEIADDEAAVEAYRAVLGIDDRNPEALAGLERLYTKLDRFAELNRVYEKEAEIAEGAREKVRALGKSAGIWEEKLGNARKAIERNEQVLQLDGGNLAAVKSLERLYRQEGLWEKFITVTQHHVGLAQDRREKVSLEVAIGEVWWKELQRVDRAEAIFDHALEADPDSREAVGALGRLYERSGNWNLALEMLKREARLAAGSKDAVEIHARMGKIQEEMLLDVPAARQEYARALDLEPGHLPSIRALKGIAEREKDRDGYLEALQAEARYVEDDGERARLLAEAGRIHQEERQDPEAAARAYEEALRRSPDFLPAARPLSDIHQARGAWAEAERVLDVIVRRLEKDGDAKELCRQRYRLGYVSEKLSKRAQALDCYRKAYELDSTYLPAMEGLGHLLVEEKSWEEALRIFQAILIHHREGLTDLEVVETYWQIGEIQCQAGQLERAQKSFEKALEMDANHEPSRRSLIRLLDGAGDHEGAVEHRQRLLPLLEGRARFELQVAVGEICRDRLKDPYQAIDAYLGAARLDPTDVGVTEALLGLYRETRQGQKAADVLSKLLERPEVQADPARAAKLHLALGEVLRDEIKDEEAAIAEMEKALDRNPRLVQAFAAVEQMLTGAKKWQALEQAYVRMIQRLPKGAEAQAARLALWKTLGELYRRVLQNPDGARMAYEVVVKAEPEDAQAVEIYADLAAQKPGQEGEAIAAYRRLLAIGAKPQKPVSALVGLHAARKAYDEAYSAAQVLAHLLGTATAEELQVVSRLRRFGREMASRGLDDALWRERLFHEKVGGPLAAIMRLVATESGALFVQSPKDLGLNPRKDEIDLGGSMLFFVNMFKYVARTLGMEKLRLFRGEAGAGRLAFANTDPPGLVAGEEMFKERPKKELWFAIAKAMAFARPELKLARLMPHDQLDVVFQAACSLGTSRFVVTADPHLVEKLKHQLEKALSEHTRTQTLKKIAREYCAVQQPGDVRAYMDGAELTSNRVATLLAGDLETAKRSVLSEKAQVSKLRDDAKVRDLVQFCVSEDYAELRERLGLSVVVTG